MKRQIQKIAKYGLRAPFVFTARFTDRLGLLSMLRVLWFRLVCRGHIGKNVRIGRDVYITPGSYISIGDDVHIGDRCVIELDTELKPALVIGSGTWISHDTHIQASGRMNIGQNVLIGEYCSIRDTSHEYRCREIPIRLCADRVGSITLEHNVWIGRGSCVLANGRELVLRSGCIVSANTVVTSEVPTDSIAVSKRDLVYRPRFRDGA
jgi:acetyltransferase-like isoleucine patch superfamily enzyme